MTSADVKIVTSADISTSEKDSVLYIGREKTAKTHNMTTWPSPLFIPFDPNMAVLNKLEVPYIALDTAEPWDHFQWYVLPKIIARELDCKTICVDSWSTGFDYLINKCKDEGLDGFDLWGAVFERGMSALRAIIDTTRPDPYNPERRSYNVVGSVHEQAETDKKGNIVGYSPAIGGQSRTRIGRIFNTMLYCMAETEFDGDGNAIQNYYCYSTPPDNLRACGDGIGGGGGKYAALPYKVSGTYPALMDAWGRAKEEDDEE